MLRLQVGPEFRRGAEELGKAHCGVGCDAALFSGNLGNARKRHPQIAGKLAGRKLVGNHEFLAQDLAGVGFDTHGYAPEG